MNTFPRFSWCGDEYFIVHVSHAVAVDSVLAAIQLDALLRSSPLEALILDTVPGWCSLLVRIAGGELEPVEVQAIVEDAASAGSRASEVEFESRRVTLPVLYDREFGSDLPFVAAVNDLSVDEVVVRLASATHFAGMVSFTPGQPQLMWLEPELQLTAPKYETPRTHTDEGVVVVGGSCLAIHSIPSPGGFQMVGRTPVPIYSPEPILPVFENKPTVLQVGDRLSLPSCTKEEYEDICQRIALGTYEYQIEPGSGRQKAGSVEWT